MIPPEIKRDHILAALDEIDRDGVPPIRESTEWLLLHQGKSYPPKYAISIAGKYASGQEHDHKLFSGGPRTNNFLKNRGFVVVRKNNNEQANKVLLKEVGISQYQDGVRINKEFHDIFNPPGTIFYVPKGKARKIRVVFNNKVFDAEYRFEGTKAKEVDLQRIQFFTPLMAEFKKVFPVPRGYFTIRIGNDRNEFIFDYEEQNEDDYQKALDDSIAKSRKDSKEARLVRLATASTKPKSIQITSVGFKRNTDVVVEVLNRAKGICERCGNDAPFIRAKDGTPYLEVHHLETLAEGGDDTVENAIAVCPNCHREYHFGF